MAAIGALVSGLVSRVAALPALRAIRHRDFRLLWTGAALSFTGTQIQSVAQGYLVYELTHDRAMLALVWFANSVPVSFFGPVLGVFADILDRRKVLVASMVVMAAGAAFLGVAAYKEFLEFWHIIAVALVNGFVMTIETPSRQSVVREVVPEQDLPTAVPTMAMTFNLARAAGPAIGGLLAAWLGAAACFWVNAVSFSGLVLAALAIRADLSPKHREPQPVRDLITEGMLYTLRESSLKVLFALECVTSFFGVFYLALMPAIAKDVFHFREVGLGMCMSSVGIGALIGLVTLASISHRPFKPLMNRIAMSSFGIAMVLLGFVKVPWIAFLLLGALGASTIVQFNTTNTLFQLIAPPHLRGRVLSMHMWAISGVSPFGTLLFGWISRQTNLETAFWIGGGAVAVGALAAWALRERVKEPELSYAIKS